MNDLDDLMKAVKAWCKAHYGDQKSLAKTLGVTPQILSRWLNRKKDPSLKNYLALKAFLEKQRGRKPK